MPYFSMRPRRGAYMFRRHHRALPPACEFVMHTPQADAYMPMVRIYYYGLDHPSLSPAQRAKLDYPKGWLLAIDRAGHYISDPHSSRGYPNPPGTMTGFRPGYIPAVFENKQDAIDATWFAYYRDEEWQSALAQVGATIDNRVLPEGTAENPTTGERLDR